VFFKQTATYGGVMSKIAGYKEEYALMVRRMVLARGKVTNVMVAKRINVTEKTIRNWRVSNKEFDLEFKEGKNLLREEINKGLIANLSPRTKESIDKQGKSSFEQVLPTHQDFTAFKALGLNESINNDAEKDKEKNIRRKIMMAKRNKEISALEAIEDLFVEGFSPPPILVKEAEKELGILNSDIDDSDLENELKGILLGGK
jgi:hypothetical protein